MDLNRRYSRLPERSYQTFREMFFDVCSKYSSNIAMRMKFPGNKDYSTWTYSDLLSETTTIGKFLINRGLKKGDFVIVYGENRPEWCFSYIATVICGLVIVPVDSSVNAESLSGIARDCGCKCIFYSAAMRSKIANTISSVNLPLIVEFDSLNLTKDEAIPSSIKWNDAKLEGLSASVELPSLDSSDASSCAVIIYTSGTTGMAKGIMLSSKGIIANVNAAIQSLNISEKDNFIAVLPLHHTYSATCSFLCPLVVGASMTFIERLIPTILLRHIKESKVTFMIAVPLVFDKIKAGIRTELKKQKGIAKIAIDFLFGLSGFCSYVLHINVGRSMFRFLRKKAGIETVRLGVAGGGPLVWDTAKFFELIGFDLVQGYGMSENGPLISVNLPEYKDNHSVGLPVKYTKARIADPGADGIGEIQVTSPSIMLGYMNNPTATRASITEDAWLRTGDLGYINKKGFIFITGRSKSIIVTEGGKNVYPEELELKFDNSNWIAEILITGRKVSLSSNGEEVIAVCYPKWDVIDKECKNGSREDFAKEKINAEIHEINKSLQSFMKIVDVIIRPEPFEKTSTQKIRRFMYKSYSEPKVQK